MIEFHRTIFAFMCLTVVVILYHIFAELRGQNIRYANFVNVDKFRVIQTVERTGKVKFKGHAKHKKQVQSEIINLQRRLAELLKVNECCPKTDPDIP